MIAKRLEIRGKVQGVFYRESMCQEAAKLGVLGWVRNRSDGSVEAWIQGENVAVEALETWAGDGPERAEVNNVRSEKVTPDLSLKTFVRKDTA